MLVASVHVMPPSVVARTSGAPSPGLPTTQPCTPSGANAASRSSVFSTSVGVVARVQCDMAPCDASVDTNTYAEPGLNGRPPYATQRSRDAHVTPTGPAPTSTPANSAWWNE